MKLRNKTDLGDPEITKQWQDYFEQQANTKTLALDLKNHDPSKQIIDRINKLSPQKEGRNTLVMVTGIPNVGKSSLINCLAGRTRHNRICQIWRCRAMRGWHEGRLRARPGVGAFDPTPGPGWVPSWRR